MPNFQMFTTGNAMKHQTVVQSDGTLKLTTVDAFLEAVPTDIQIYGHNFIWHTQQNQNYLKSLNRSPNEYRKRQQCCQHTYR